MDTEARLEWSNFALHYFINRLKHKSIKINVKRHRDKAAKAGGIALQFHTEGNGKYLHIKVISESEYDLTDRLKGREN